MVALMEKDVEAKTGVSGSGMDGIPVHQQLLMPKKPSKNDECRIVVVSPSKSLVDYVLPLIGQVYVKSEVEIVSCAEFNSPDYINVANREMNKKKPAIILDTQFIKFNGKEFIRETDVEKIILERNSLIRRYLASRLGELQRKICDTYATPENLSQDCIIDEILSAKSKLEHFLDKDLRRRWDEINQKEVSVDCWDRFKAYTEWAIKSKVPLIRFKEHVLFSDDVAKYNFPCKVSNLKLAGEKQFNSSDLEKEVLSAIRYVAGQEKLSAKNPELWNPTEVFKTYLPPSIEYKNIELIL